MPAAARFAICINIQYSQNGAMSAEILGRVAPRGAPLPLFGCSVSAGFPSPADDYAEAWLSLDELVGIRAPSTYLGTIEKTDKIVR